MRMFKMIVTQFSLNISYYCMIMDYKEVFDVGIHFLYYEQENIIHPDKIFIRDVRTMCGGYQYKNPSYILSKNHNIESSRDMNYFKILCSEFNTFSDTVLRCIDEYCGIYKPTLIYDFERVKANP